MAAPASVFQDSFIVLFTNTHVMFLEMNEQRRAEALKKRKEYFRNGTIELITTLPPEIQLGRVYRHYSPTGKNL